mmetsp:Transcript_21450/g.49966  ORF Transcript_21450/g.49966 Transcript_21450/m.49966 type:complete len:172 (-) Transcript_21450:108-623(-)
MCAASRKKPLASFGAAHRPFGRLPASPEAKAPLGASGPAGMVDLPKESPARARAAEVRRMWQQRCEEVTMRDESSGSDYEDLDESAPTPSACLRKDAPQKAQPSPAARPEGSSRQWICLEEPCKMRGSPSKPPAWARRIYALPAFVQQRLDMTKTLDEQLKSCSLVRKSPR